jgi:NitT/TauT family transport system permease protein
MRAIPATFGTLGRYLWSGWAGATGLFCVAAAWQAGHEAYGEFILPAPLETFRTLAAIIAAPEFHAVAIDTALRSLAGFAIAASGGTLLGIAAGYSFAAIRVLKPIVTVILGVPPIAWIVLALIWFGASGGTVIATIVIAAVPIAFAGAVEGVATRDRGLESMATAFGAGPLRRFWTVVVPHLVAHLFPAWTTTLGTAFKVAVMAELLANAGGIGGALARSRANLDVAEAMAWVVLVVAMLLAIEYGVLHPVRAALERWREAGAPWGLKR